MQKLLWIALAGAAGTLARYGLGKLVQGWAGQGFPWGTAAVNLLGCLLFGLVWSLAEERGVLDPQAGIIVLSGFMGAFTTFSTFSFETVELFQNGQWGLGAVNALGQLGAGLVGVGAGLVLGRL